MALGSPRLLRRQIIMKRKNTKIFFLRLEELGFKNYQEYLQSAYWKSIKKRYRESKLPQMCLVCASVKYELHHRSYKRLGEEIFGDLIPLCRLHHYAVHDYLKDNSIPLSRTHEAVGYIGGFTKKQVVLLFSSFYGTGSWFGEKVSEVLPLRNKKRRRKNKNKIRRPTWSVNIQKKEIEFNRMKMERRKA